MTQTDTTNRQWVLAKRPTGEPTKDTLTLKEITIPTAGDNQMLLRTEYLSLDPYMRSRMSDAPSYASPVEIGEVMIGGTVAQVVNSNVNGFQPNDYVLSFNGWQDYALSDGSGVTKLDQSPAHLSWALGILGMPGCLGWPYADRHTQGR
jgi:NADPH-dependent curcumin reductase CurA